MSKILTEVYLPVKNETFDVYLYDDMLIGETVKLLACMFEEIAEGFFCSSNINFLCDREEGKIFPSEKTLRESGIKNHTKLMFV